MEAVSRRYHYRFVAAAFFCVAVIMGLENNLYSLYLLPVTETLGVSRGAFSSAQSVRCLAAFISNLLFGGVCRRYGVRRPLLACIALVTLSYVWYGFAQNLVPFFVGALVFGLGESFLNTAGMAYLAKNWFSSHLGVATGIIMAASGLGGAALGVALAAIIAQSGWRTSFFVGAGLMALTGLVVLLVIRETPESLGLRLFDEAQAESRASRRAQAPSAWEGLPLRQLLKKPYFYLAAGSVLLCAICTYGSYPVVTAHLQDQGMPAVFAASMFSLMMLLLAGAKILVGLLNDRFGAPRAMLLCMICNVLGTCLLAVTAKPYQAVAMTALMGLALCTQTFLQPLLASQLFGRQGSGAAVGILLAMVSAGGLAAPPLVNFSFDRLGSYTPVLLALGGVAALALALFLAAVHGARRAKAAAGQTSRS